MEFSFACHVRAARHDSSVRAAWFALGFLLSSISSWNSCRGQGRYKTAYSQIIRNYRTLALGELFKKFFKDEIMDKDLQEIMDASNS